MSEKRKTKEKIEKRNAKEETDNEAIEWVPKRDWGDAIEQLERQRQQVLRIASSAERRRNFLQGIMLGLFYGIIGNMIVSHYYGLLEEFGNPFWLNISILVSCIILVVLTSVKWFMRTQNLEEMTEEIAQYTGRVQKLIEDMRDLKERKEYLEARFLSHRELTYQCKKCGYTVEEPPEKCPRCGNNTWYCVEM